MILSREEMYQLDLLEQKRFAEKQAREEGLSKGKAEGLAKGKVEGLAKGKVKGKAESIECLLQIRFPDDFADRFQPWRSKLYEKPLPVLDSLFPLSVSCSSLSEFTQNL